MDSLCCCCLDFSIILVMQYEQSLLDVVKHDRTIVDNRRMIPCAGN